MGAGHLADIAARLIDGGRAPETPGRRGPVGHAAGAAHDPRDAGDGGRRRGAGAERDRRRQGRGAGSRVVRVPARCSGAPSSSPGPASRRARCGPGSSCSVPRSRAPDDRARAAGRSRSRTWLRYAWLVRHLGERGRRAVRPRARARRPRRPRARAGCRSRRSGPGTAAALERRGIRADLVPERFVAESLLDGVPGRPSRSPAGPTGAAGPGRSRRATCCPRGSRRWATRSTCCRCTGPCGRCRARAARARAAGQVDAITFTSSSTVTGFCDLVGPLPDPQPLVVSIGPITSQTATERGIRVDVEADPHSIDGLVDALLDGAPRPEARSRAEPCRRTR